MNSTFKKAANATFQIHSCAHFLGTGTVFRKATKLMESDLLYSIINESCPGKIKLNEKFYACQWYIAICNTLLGD